MGTHGKLVIRMYVITRRLRHRPGTLTRVEHAKQIVVHSQYCDSADVAGLWETFKQDNPMLHHDNLRCTFETTECVN